MPLTWVEDNSSRSATIYRLGKRSTSTRTKSYKVFGTTDDTTLHDEANTVITGQLMFWQYPGAGNQQLRAESYSVEYLGDDAWHVEIQYEKIGADDTDQQDPYRRSRSFETGGQTQHITQAVGGTINGVATGANETKFPNTAPNQFGAIGVDGDSVAGVDIVVPQLTWTEQYDVPSTYVTANYIKGVSAMTGTVNNASFRTFAAGEVLFLGASGTQEWDSQKGDGPWTLTFKFAASANVTGLTIGSITDISKKGHDYLWIRYEDDVGDNTLLKKPKHVYVNKVYRDGNFSLLGIGTS